MLMQRREILLAIPAMLACLTAAPRAALAGDVDPALKGLIKAITNVFEVGKAEADYGYVEDLKDGRGFTVTNYGFVTKEREVAQIIARLVAKVPDTALKDFLPRLPPLAKGDDAKALKDFPAAWRAAAKATPELAKACEQLADKLYFGPAMAAAERYRMTSPLGRAIVYDTLIQHGDGDDRDSLGAIHQRTLAATADSGDAPETDRLFAFLEVRRDVLLHPADTATAKGWRLSVTRVDALENILAENPGLVSPVRVRNKEIDVMVS